MVMVVLVAIGGFVVLLVLVDLIDLLLVRSGKRSIFGRRAMATGYVIGTTSSARAQVFEPPSQTREPHLRGHRLLAELPGLTFAGLLRQLRLEARLTQEELAEAARLSSRSISDLERGIHRTARKDTAILLADAFGMAGQLRQVFVAAARGKAEPCEVLQVRKCTVPRACAAATALALPRGCRRVHRPARRVGAGFGRRPRSQR
jgi:transcriptional regulator with XRE-family HTH domain